MNRRTVQLGEVAEVQRNAASDSECLTLPYVGLEHIKKDTGNFEDDFRRKPESLLATKFRFTPRHVLYGKLRPYLNKVALPDFDGVCTTEILPLFPKDGVLDRDFLYWLLLSSGFVNWASQRVSGANLPRLDPGLLKEFTFDLPSLSEQQRIAGLLEQADRLRRTRRYALELSDTFLPAAFLELFDSHEKSWQTVTVGELAAPKRGSIRTGPFGSQLLHSEFTDSGIAVLGIDNAVNNRFEWAERRYISPAKYEQLKRYTVFPGDVLITIMGTCGRCAVVPDGIPAAVNTKHLCCITLDQSRCLPVFLHGAFLYHPQIRRQLGVLQKGAIMDGLNMEIIKGLRFALPPLPLQQQFAALVARHEHLRATQREALRQAEHLFQTLLHRAFSEAL
jgi:type I restriction enzyme S subunit